MFFPLLGAAPPLILVLPGPSDCCHTALGPLPPPWRCFSQRRRVMRRRPPRTLAATPKRRASSLGERKGVEGGGAGLEQDLVGRQFKVNQWGIRSKIVHYLGRLVEDGRAHELTVNCTCSVFRPSLVLPRSFVASLPVLPRSAPSLPSASVHASIPLPSHRLVASHVRRSGCDGPRRTATGTPRGRRGTGRGARSWRCTGPMRCPLYPRTERFGEDRRIAPVF